MSARRLAFYLFVVVLILIPLRDILHLPVVLGIPALILEVIIVLLLLFDIFARIVIFRADKRNLPTGVYSFGISSKGFTFTLLEGKRSQAAEYRYYVGFRRKWFPRPTLEVMYPI